MSATKPKASARWKKGTLIKWDDEKGFGFIQPLNKKEGDIFIHISGFRADTEYRPRVDDVLYYQVSQDKSTGKSRACNAYIKDANAKSKKSLTWKKGTLTKWDDEKGFGFIQPINKREAELFIHISGFRADMERRPIVGDTLYYQITQDEKTGKNRACKAHVKGVKDSDKERFKLHPAFEILAQSLIMLPFGASLFVWWAVGNGWPLIIYGLMSILTMMLYYDDKHNAQQKRWRTAEYKLHLAELLGGWPGALIAQYNLRHKNAKTSYQLEFWVIVCLHGVWWMAYVIYLMASPR